MPFFQVSLFDKSRGIQYHSSQFNTYKAAHGAYTEFIDSDFMSNFFDITISKITQKASFTSTPESLGDYPLAGFYYDAGNDAHDHVLHIISGNEHNFVEKVMIAYGIPVTYDWPGAYFSSAYLETIRSLGAEDIRDADPDEFQDISVVGTSAGFSTPPTQGTPTAPPPPPQDDASGGEDETDDEYVPDDVEEESEPEESTDFDLSGYFYFKYGKGYILTCPDTFSNFADPYFLDGWWNDNAQGWFFKSEFKQMLKERGAVRLKLDSKSKRKLDFTASTEAPSSSASASAGTVDETLEGMVFFTFGRGFIMKAPKNDARWGTKYFHGGWWNTKQEGWFFKNGTGTVERLIDLGAKHLTSKKSSKRS
jgi:hypothetical protein